MNEKDQLRRDMRRLRTEACRANGSKIQQNITAQLLDHPAYQRAEKLFIYLSVNSEVNTYAIIRDALKNEKRIYVPVCLPKTHDMLCVRLRNLSVLEPGPYQIPIPPEPHQITEKHTIDLCIVPGLAFDRQGFRLGYGGGYYDRFLKGYSGTAFGLCYHACFLERLPRLQTDMCVDGIFTEQDFYPVQKTEQERTYAK